LRTLVETLLLGGGLGTTCIGLGKLALAMFENHGAPRDYHAIISGIGIALAGFTLTGAVIWFD